MKERRGEVRYKEEEVESFAGVKVAGGRESPARWYCSYFHV